MKTSIFKLSISACCVAYSVPTASAIVYNEVVNSTVVASKFGNDTTGAGGKDGFFAGSASTTGTTRGVHGTAIFTGTTDVSSNYNGMSAAARTSAAATGDLTSTSSGGGLINRFQVVHDGSGVVSMASPVSAWVDINAGSITTANGVFVQVPSLVAGTSITNYYGVHVDGGTISGVITNHYGIRVDALESGTNRFGLYIQSDPTFLGGTLTVNGEVSGTGVTTTSAINKLVKTNGSGKIDPGLLGDGSQLTGLTKAQVSLGAVNNTSDLDKPVSTLQAAADAAVQAYGVQRQYHTGTQPISSVVNLQSSLDAKLNSDGGAITTDGAGNIVVTSIKATAPAGDILMGDYGL